MKPIIPVMRTALEQIQKMHRSEPCEQDCQCDEGLCISCADTFPCPTRKLADEALDRMARTNQGENNGR